MNFMQDVVSPVFSNEIFKIGCGDGNVIRMGQNSVWRKYTSLSILLMIYRVNVSQPLHGSITDDVSLVN